MSKLKMVKELSNTVLATEIKEIYDKGHKVVVSFDKDKYVDPLFEVLSPDSPYGDGLVDEENVKCKKEFFVKNEDLYIKSGCDVVIDSIQVDDEDLIGSTFCVHPFKGRNAECHIKFPIHSETLKVADRVFEVKY